jgi:phosphomevalonate kinase
MKHHERNEDKKEEPKYLITHLEREIIMKLEELLTINNSIKDQLTKIDQEIITKLAELQTAIDKLTEQLAAVELTDEQAASVVAVQDAVNAIDAIIPDSIV